MQRPARPAHLAFTPGAPPPTNLLQVRCLKVLRAIEAGTPAEELVPADFKPTEKALALLSRGPSGAAQHPFVGGVEDTLLIRWVLPRAP